jgi:hypothetical protein
MTKSPLVRQRILSARLELPHAKANLKGSSTVARPIRPRHVKGQLIRRRLRQIRMTRRTVMAKMLQLLRQVRRLALIAVGNLRRLRSLRHLPLTATNRTQPPVRRIRHLIRLTFLPAFAGRLFMVLQVKLSR